MTNAFTNSAAQITDMSVSYASVSEALRAVTKIAKNIATIDATIELKRGDKAGLIISSIAGMKLVMDNNTDDSITAASQGEGMGIVPGTVSIVRQVGSIASFAKSGFDDASKFNSLTEAKCIDYIAKIEAWYGFETAGTPSAPSVRSLFADLLALDGDVRLTAIQSVREIFGSVSKIYTIAKGSCVHADAPEPEQDGMDGMTEAEVLAKFTQLAANLVAFGNKYDVAQNRQEFVMRSLWNGDNDEA